MLLPSLMNGNFFDDWMPEFPSGKEFFRGTGANGMMKTDVKETEDTFELEMDLPGFKKEDVSAKLENGYMTTAESNIFGTLKYPSIPFMLRDTPAVPFEDAPALGNDTEALLTAAGCGKAEMEAWKEKEII